ncbi:tetratricopeptide repeat protein [Tuwongella immobilis]|uniref:protein O-GlcNAc transferase n=1 Tax=Tuwongella immobilis TaxID=692036 RepID=A0A6C2YNX1_9BACT|nr:glycosyltransferase family 41 protein [Tuwongella immobilis]VIP03320.1 tpr repeat-containing protein : Tetratricopeptide TPR_2 repeat protein OS=Chthoniobacter flavus Ellin428 GN=CfE428DRAFT_1080 PE=4 SV=1: TPR_11: TPR_11: TPR_11: TPR_11: Glyco_transf_41: Glyco_transf_41 [Tuwongella immobilis]VTS04011.1 tpr repeat-containing protein : Tetratricopeptide TPR_2 repeat protein OS=Chthoniobacter flavus Ellin428 GN=CfE428DRAFT_1080 PE=4 SV=1: TPR_11: TPR_11: TPR_11: TPR_11: Glyco_transf_41: Glyco_tr
MTPDDLFAQAAAAHQAGQLAEAERGYLAVLESSPDYPAALTNLGVIRMRQGHTDSAIQLYQRAIAVEPDNPDTHFNLGNALRKVNRLQEAASCYQQTVHRNPQHYGGFYNLGLVLLSVGNLEQACLCFQRTIEINPALPEAVNHLGDTLGRLGRTDEAIQVFRQLIQQFPDFHRAYNNLALALSNRGEHELGLNIITQVLSRKFDYVEAWNTHGLLLEALNRPDEALPSYERAVSLRPTFAEGQNNLGLTYTELFRHEEAIAARRKAVELDPTRAAVHSNLLLAMHYPGTFSPEELVQAHREWAERHAEPLQNRIQPLNPDWNPNRRLRIGMISPDFRTHTVANFLMPMIQHLNRDEFDLLIYAHVPRPDAMTAQFRDLVPNFLMVDRANDDQLAEQIRRDRIDILVDYAGHTANHRLLTLARKPAPIQITHFGYPDTTGMSTVDYRITDTHSEPPGTTEAYSTERLAYLPEVAWCWQPPESAPKVGDLPALRNRHLTFGILNNPAKLNEKMIATWAEMLRAIPDARLIVLAGRGGLGSDRIAERFSAFGVSPNRLRIVPRLPAADYLALHQEIDIALDPFPYNGGITSCDALWMGVPILTLAGNTYVSRQGLMLMQTVVLPEFIAESLADIRTIAQRLNEDIVRLSVIRAELRERFRATTIVNASKYAQQLGALYRQLWQQNCQGR